MKAVAGLLLLLPLCHGVETSCDGQQNNTKCYGALGGSVSIQLVTDASKIFRFEWFRNNRKILELQNGHFVVNELESRSVITDSNGTIRINNLNRDDAGEYKLEIFNSDGIRTGLKILQLIIQAAVSSVRLNSECLSQGEMRVSCSSDRGDSPQYSWSLNGVTLNDTQYSSGSDKSSITLERGVSGRLLCSVSNNVSADSKAENISSCVFINCTLYNGTFMSEWVKEGPDKPQCYVQTTTPTSPTEGKETGTTVSNKPSTNITTSSQTSSNTDPPWYIMTPDKLTVMAGILSALVFLLVVGTVFIYVYKKRKSNKDQAEEDEQELTYADVRILKGGQVQQQRAEGEVEYGQIKISNRPRQPAEPTGDDCVYAKVRRTT